MTTPLPESLRLAEALTRAVEHEAPDDDTIVVARWFVEDSAAELRRLHEAHESSLRTIDRKADAIQELLVQRDELIELNQELLAALKGALDVCIWPGSVISDVHSKARAAIAKATGETK
jgi:hypothetical protein